MQLLTAAVSALHMQVDRGTCCMCCLSLHRCLQSLYSQAVALLLTLLLVRALAHEGHCTTA